MQKTPSQPVSLKKTGKTVSYIYAGARGGGLESTLCLYEASLRAGIASRLVLSVDNVRRQLVEKLYPEAEFINFSSPSAIRGEASRLSGNIAFFTMISPKMLPLFLAAHAKKIFYFHASYDTSYSPPRLGSFFSDKYYDVLHSIAIRHSDLVVATQYPLAWQVKIRFDKPALGLLHPPYSMLRKGFFSEYEDMKLPFKTGTYFLDFGGIDRPYKGTDVLYNAVQGTSIPTIFAGKASRELEGKNIAHIDRWLSDGEMHCLVKNAKCVVAPYLASSQFSGCMALAFRFGVPVLAPFCPAFEGWIEENRTGWFFSQGDWNSLREQMQGISSGRLKYSKAAIAQKEKEMEGKSVLALASALEALLK